ncbi:TetR/AcrR family transcriptional regulator [Nitriliruptoraceae bacterium ZYF776]|nr:TetR/AcrR family transcriptional regulator [Profundirhabdus halotolerans]
MDAPDTSTAPRRPAYDVERLLAVAVEVFDERGYDGTSMGDLARALGLSKSSIYHHVAGKEALLGMALDRALDALFAVLDEPASQTGTARSRLEHVLRRSVEVLHAELPFVTLLLRVRGNTPTEVDALARRREFDQRVTDLVTRAVHAGELRDDLEPGIVTRLLFGQVNSLVEWYRPDRGAGPTEVGDALVSLAMDGLRPR